MLRSFFSALSLGLLAAAGCSSDHAAAPPPRSPAPWEPRPSEPSTVRPLWAFDPKAHFDSTAFAASWFSRSNVLVTSRNGPKGEGKVTSLDPATGTTRWERPGAEWVLHPPQKLTPLIFVGPLKSAPNTWQSTYDSFVEVETGKGSDVRVVKLAEPIRALDALIAHAGDRLIYLATSRQPSADPAQGTRVIGAIDLASGKKLWEAPSQASHLFPPLIVGDRVIFADPVPVAYSLADGHELFRLTTHFTLVASPDGAHLYASRDQDKPPNPADPGQSGELGPDGKLTARYTGTVVAASDRHVAVQVGGPQPLLQVYRHGETTPVWTDSKRGAGASVTSVALKDDRVVFFRTDDKHVWMHDLSTNTDRSLVELYPDYVVSPDPNASLPAHVRSPAVLDGDELFLHDSKILAYQLLLKGRACTFPPRPGPTRPTHGSTRPTCRCATRTSPRTAG